MGCFQQAGIAGKIQHGAAWWFNDHKTGITEQMISLANLGLLGNFVGMLTDSRSFLSYTRHEYFRRILCGIIGTCLANLGLLGNFVGMLTDSRSFLSYTRHEYFRRILCGIIGTWVENGEYPADMTALKKIIEGISYNNALRFFGFKLEDDE